MRNRKRNRLKGYDYSWDHLYFVTICVQDRVCCFGDVVGTSHDLSLRSGVVEDGVGGTSHDLSVRGKGGLKNKMVLNAYGKIAYERMEWLADRYCYVDLHSFIIMPNHVHAIIEINSLKVVDEGMKIKSLSELMGAYKTTSSKLIHLAGYSDFKWQRSFHDHIIRNDRAYQNISTYIVTNAEHWRSDTFFN